MAAKVARRFLRRFFCLLADASASAKIQFICDGLLFFYSLLSALDDSKACFRVLENQLNFHVGKHFVKSARVFRLVMFRAFSYGVCDNCRKQFAVVVAADRRQQARVDICNLKSNARIFFKTQTRPKMLSLRALALVCILVPASTFALECILQVR